MSKINRIIVIILLSIPGIIISFIIFYILEIILIPDDCKYHFDDKNWYIRLMFDFPNWNGNHPYPSNFQYFIILFFGVFLSYYISNKFISKN